MDFNQLETFLCVCKCKGFSKAARELYISQPTVSNHISSLEVELGVLLINRSSKNLTLTLAGEHFLTFSQKALVEKAKLSDVLLQLSNVFKGVIDIISSTVPEIQLLPDVMFKFKEMYPEAKFKIRHFDSMEVIEEIENQNFPFGFTGYKKKNSPLKFVKLDTDEIVLIEGKDSGFIKTNSTQINAQELNGLPFIMREEGSGSKYFIKEFLKDNINFDIVAEVESTDLIKKMVGLNMGIGFVSKKALSEQEQKTLNVYSLANIEMKRDLYFTYNPNAYLNPLEEKFIQMLISMKPLL